MSRIKLISGWPIPKNYTIEKVKTYWGYESNEVTAYIARHYYSDGDDFQLGTFRWYYKALFSTWKSNRLMKQLKKEEKSWNL